MPILHWRLGRITRTYKGNDEAVRVVDAKTQNDEFKRAINRLAPLCENEEESLPLISERK